MFYLGYLQEYGYVTYRGRNDFKMAATPKPTLAWVTAHENRNMECAEQPGQVGECCAKVVPLIGLSPF